MEIIKTSTQSLLRKYWLVAGFALSGSPALFAADVVLQKVPPLTVEQAPAYPENLARYHLGAQIEALPKSATPAKLQLSSKAEDRNTSEAALLCDDPTTGYVLPAGTTTFLVTLPNIENIENLSLLNGGAKGEMMVATSNAKLPVDSPQWQSAEKSVQLTAGAVSDKIGPSEAKYLKVSFNVTQPGRIAAFGVYATPAVSDFTMPRPRKVSFEESSESFALATYNFTDLHAKARAAYVSSGTDVRQANNMIDDQPGTAYNFAADDASPMAVIDLGKVCSLRRLSTVFSSRPGSVEFYVFKSLPVKQTAETAELSASDVQPVSNSGTKVGSDAPMQTPDLPKTLKVSDGFFAKMKSVGSVVNTGAEGSASVDFPATPARYVVVKWTPAPGQSGGLSVAEIAAFGSSKSTGAASSGGRVAGDGKQLGDGKEVAGKNVIEDSDVPGQGPENPPAQPENNPAPPGAGPPPALPQPPPFTFIPLVPPVGPTTP